MSKPQASKRSRDARLLAKMMGVPAWVGHASHVSGRRLRYCVSPEQVSRWQKKYIQGAS